jgi:hypothetical protein
MLERLRRSSSICSARCDVNQVLRGLRAAACQSLIYNCESSRKQIKRVNPMFTQKSIYVIALIIAMLSSCTRDAPPTTVPIETVADFRQALSTAGVEVRSLETDMDVLPVFQSWDVRGETIHLYSFNSASDREQLMELVVDPQRSHLDDGQELQIWEEDSFMIIYPGTDGGLVLLISGLLSDPITRKISGPDEPYPPAISAAQQFLSDELEVSPTEIIVVDYAPAVWSDSCLGLAGTNEVCAQVETTGWRIELNVMGNNYILRSDETGVQIRPVQ